MGDHMEIKMQIEKLYKALNDSELPDKAELKREIGCCINSLIDYYHTVVSEQLYYLSTTADERNSYIIKQKDEQRSEKHDNCVRSCSRLNEICQAVNIEPICDFDTNDRRKVAEFCGFAANSLYFSNITGGDKPTDDIYSTEIEQSVVDLFVSVFENRLAEKLQIRFSELQFQWFNAYIMESVEGVFLYVEYEDSNGYRDYPKSEIDLRNIRFPGYIDKVVDRFYWEIVSDRLAREEKVADLIIRLPEPKDRLEKLLNRFNAEFIEWRKSKLEDCDGDVNRLIQYICQLMYDVFHTQDSALDDLLSPIDKNEIEEKLKCWSKDYQFVYEDYSYAGQDDQKIWQLSKESVNSVFRVNLTQEGYINLRWIKVISKTSKRFRLGRVYHLDALESEIKYWLKNTF